MAVVYLTGFMGAGKSNVGKRLASKLSVKFVDLDTFIEEKHGAKINELFKAFGEKLFRQFERDAVLSFKDYQENVIIALGGGTICYNGTLSLVQETGELVYLKCSVDSLYFRLKDDKNSRPLIKNASNEELRELIEQRLHEREQYYYQARTIIDMGALKEEDDKGLLDLMAYLMKA